ncbi:MAG: hypothetical protein WC458_02090 [Patescibacteria group bacterium]
MKKYNLMAGAVLALATLSTQVQAGEIKTDSLVAQQDSATILADSIAVRGDSVAVLEDLIGYRDATKERRHKPIFVPDTTNAFVRLSDIEEPSTKINDTVSIVFRPAYQDFCFFHIPSGAYLGFLSFKNREIYFGGLYGRDDWWRVADDQTAELAGEIEIIVKDGAAKFTPERAERFFAEIANGAELRP